MNKSLMVVVAMAWLLAGRMASAAENENVLDELLQNPARLQDAKMLGYAVLSLGYPEVAEHTREELRKNYWAFAPDLKLSREELEAETAKFNAMCDSLTRLVREYEVTSLKLVGLDVACTYDCQDWYFASATKRGPVLIRISINFREGGARMFGVETYTGWDKVKAVYAAMQHKAGAKVLTINYDPPTKKNGAESSPGGAL